MENKSYAVPVIVTIAIIILAGAFFFYQGPSIDNGQTASIIQSLAPLLQPAEDVNMDSLRAVSGDDLLRGEAAAPIKLVIYSNLECPACAWFHDQLGQMSDYIKEGKVAVAFRHFPLDSIHPSARKLAVAAECAGKLGGSEKFWQFIDFVFAAPDKSAESLVADATEAIGLDIETMTSCQAEKEISDAVESEYQEATGLGAQGTPFIAVVGPDDLVMPIFGGREAKDLKQAIDMILADEAEPIVETEIETEIEEAAATSSATE